MFGIRWLGFSSILLCSMVLVGAEEGTLEKASERILYGPSQCTCFSTPPESDCHYLLPGDDYKKYRRQRTKVPCEHRSCERKWQCTWKATKATHICERKPVKYTLHPDEGINTCKIRFCNYCSFYSPVAALPKTKKKPLTFDFKISAGSKCTIYHGFSERESTKTPNALVELKSLPVGNCEPIRVLCTDTPLRTRGRNGRWGSHSLPGPAIVVTFTANKETLVYDEYDVIAIKNPSALHQRMTFWQAKRSRAFGDLLVAPALSQAVKQTYPTWWEDFGLGSGPQAEWISAPLSVKPPYVPDRRPMSALFLIQPPYCAPPYVSRPRQTAGR